MESKFADVVAAWGNFYTLVGTAAITLIGLLFVVVSLRPELFGGQKHLGVQALAVQTFASLLSLFIISLLFLIPHQDVDTLAWSLAISGAVGVVGVVRHLWRSHLAVRRQWGWAFLFWRFLAPGAAYLWLCLIGIALAQTEHPVWIHQGVWSVAMLIVQATRNAWDLLVVVGTGAQPPAD